MRRRVPPVDFSHAKPPPELLRFVHSVPAPIGARGRPEPWRREWRAEEFAAWLRTRAAWRDTHAEPLPGLSSLERAALQRLELPPGLVEAEERAPQAPPPPDPRELLRGP